MDLEPLVLRDGSRTGAVGRVVGYRARVWFEPALPARTVAHPPGSEPPPRPSGRAVLTSGVDLDRLADRREEDGGVEGWATLAGRWRTDHLFVSQQGPPEAAAGTPGSSWDRPPCGPPPGGWPHGPVDANLDPPPAEAIPGAVAVTLFRPSATQVVLVVASTEPAAAEARLRPVFGEAICVVQSRWTTQSVDQVQADLRRHWDGWTVLRSGLTTSEAGQAVVTTDVVRVLPEMAAWARSVPADLLRVSPWLSPVG